MTSPQLTTLQSAGRAALYLLCIATPLSAQRVECRQPTALESQAVNQAVRMLKDTIEGPVTSLGWALQTRKSDQIPLAVATNPNPKRPLMSCWPLYDAKFQITPANPSYAQLHSLAEKGDAVLQTWMAACIKNGYKGCDVQPPEVKQGIRAKTASAIAIRVTENSPYMRGPQESPIAKIDAPPGIAVAYQSPAEEDQQDTTLCVGPWKPDAVFRKGGGLSLFPFEHPAGTPFIENLCVNIAVAEMADAVLHKVNWQTLNSALSK